LLDIIQLAGFLGRFPQVPWAGPPLVAAGPFGILWRRLARWRYLAVKLR